MNCTESILASRFAFASVSHLSLRFCVFLEPLTSTVESRVLAHLINFPEECQVRFEILIDASLHLLSPGSVDVWLCHSTQNCSAITAHFASVREAANLAPTSMELPSFILTLHWGPICTISPFFPTLSKCSHPVPQAYILFQLITRWELTIYGLWWIIMLLFHDTHFHFDRGW